MIKVAELFAGVGGFRLGLEGRRWTNSSRFQVVWSNQWEPSTKAQHANQIYTKRWSLGEHCPEDISTVDTAKIPAHDLLVGGFPCQDYSVATTLKSSKGLIGKKGVLWWQIHRILEQKKSKKPKYLLLENVDRLLKSPSSQRGRDFAIILSSLNQLGYAVEWKVINAADYGMPQRRRRIFIMGYHRSTPLYKQAKAQKDIVRWITQEGVLGNTFGCEKFPEGTVLEKTELSDDLVKLSEQFNQGGKTSPFQNSGFMVNGAFYSVKATPNYRGKPSNLGDFLLPLKDVPKEFLVNKDSLEKWNYLKGAKDEKRYNKAQDFYYSYNEGAMVFPDALDKPSRTIITGEGGPSPSRFKHVVKQNGKLRRLTPVELERLNMFPDGHTELDGVTDGKRAFLMGNALVVGVVTKIGKELAGRT
jgi:DNA (cytosine-5)-methyltransferase 1